MAITHRDLHVWRERLEALHVIPKEVRRIIIDIPLDAPVVVYYECNGDARMFSVDLAEALHGVDAIGVSELDDEGR